MRFGLKMLNIGTWRKLWVALAETERELGIDITEEQINEMRAHVDDIDYDVVRIREKECRHDVMAHVYEFGTKCPSAKGIIHLGATSCFVTDNADVILMTEALKIVRQKLILVIRNLRNFAMDNRKVTCLRLYSFSTSSTYDCWKESYTLASGFSRRFGGA
jgi:adenylosuccinate lyase